MFGFIASIIGTSTDESGDAEYAVCEEHGHDYRDPEFDKFRVIDHNIESIWQSQFTELPDLGLPESYHEVKKVYRQPCRDCPKETTTEHRYELIFRFEDDSGEAVFLTEDEYSSREPDEEQ